MTVTFRVQLDFDYAGDGSITFAGIDDISAYVQNVQTRIGGEAGQLMARAGACTLTLYNDQRNFSPELSVLYAGKLRPNRAIRVDAVTSTGYQPIFRGFTKSFTPQPHRWSDRTITIECQDYIGLLQDAQLDLPILTNIRSDNVILLTVNNAFNAPVATGRLDYSANPSAADSVTVNGQLYTYVSALTDDDQILLGTSAYTGRYDSIDRTIAAINGLAGAGTTYSTNTDRPIFVRARESESFYSLARIADLVRWYRMGEPSGTIAHDFGGNASDGTYQNAPTLASSVLISGDSNTSVSFDGTNDRVDVPTVDFSNQNWTWIDWILHATSPPANQDFFSVYSAFVAGGAIYMRLYNTGVVYCEIYSNGSVQSAAGVISFGAASAYMIAVTYQYSTSTLSLYVNGTLRDSDTVSPFTGAGSVIQIAAFTAAGGNTYKGNMQDCGWAFRCLSADEILALYTARQTSPGITLYSTLRGTTGNLLSLAKSSAGITTSGATLSGGSDMPTSDMGGKTYQTGVQTHAYVADRWTPGEMRAYQAIQQLVETEQGWFYQAKDGELKFDSGNQKFLDGAETSVISIDETADVALLYGEVTDELIKNDVRVSFEPRATSSVGVVAQAKSPIKVPGKWGKLSSDPNFGKNREELENPDGGLEVRTLRYTDLSTGKAAGAKDLILPLVAGTDYTLNTKSDGSGADYTYGDPATGIPYFFISAAEKATEVDLYFKNTALGELYFIDGQVRGTLITRYDKQTITKDDPSSIREFGRRIMSVSLPLGGDGTYATSLAEYLLQRNKDPRYDVKSVTFKNVETMGDVDVFTVDIGDKVELYEYQTIAADSIPKMRVVGMSCEIDKHDGFSLTWDLERVDVTPFGVYDDATYGLYDEVYYTV